MQEVGGKRLVFFEVQGASAMLLAIAQPAWCRYLAKRA